ncbi:hypothetical protein [Altererythrobacter aquiaggeris]|uniref:hypothetical protein n=1 Tax=Aestuarierythrobacter aquiaggeris TaxID=1898396 RepID=UPI00301B4EAE
MSQTYEFYEARAEEAAEEARKAPLQNVKERALRSEAAWRSMAERVLRTAEERKIADEARAERRAAEQARAAAAAAAAAETAETAAAAT